MNRGTAQGIDEAEKRFKARSRLMFIQKFLGKDVVEKKYRDRLANLKIPSKVVNVINEELVHTYKLSHTYTQIHSLSLKLILIVILFILSLNHEYVCVCDYNRLSFHFCICS
jgi:hypothetical protein